MGHLKRGCKLITETFLGDPVTRKTLVKHTIEKTALNEPAAPGGPPRRRPIPSSRGVLPNQVSPD